MKKSVTLYKHHRFFNAKLSLWYVNGVCVGSFFLVHWAAIAPYSGVTGLLYGLLFATFAWNLAFVKLKGYYWLRLIK
ncbi:hypothetical protein [Nitrosomonas sp.]|uniref:hypothetical protein n=1 Tax=Nitrosomonas sp. TaxID=42353 RepID=UPI0025D94066|nr:hypothetical protein [Nitrosomonas sp.]